MPVLFDDLWDYQNPGETEDRFRQLLPAAEAKSDLSYRLQLLTQIARAEGLQREFDAARSTLDAVADEMEGAPAVVRVRWLLEKGRLERSSGNPEASKPLFLEAWELAGPPELDFYAGDAAHMLGIVEGRDESLAWNEKALARAETSADPMAQRWRGSLANNIGWTYFEAEEYEPALKHSERALEIREEAGKVDNIRIAKWCVAKAYRVLGRTDEALAAQQALLAEYEADGETSGYTQEEIGECLLALGRDDEAVPHFAAAWQELHQDQWLADAEPERIARLKELGRVE